MPCEHDRDNPDFCPKCNAERDADWLRGELQALQEAHSALKQRILAADRTAETLNEKGEALMALAAAVLARETS